jgi:hypothetical protein
VLGGNASPTIGTRQGNEGSFGWVFPIAFGSKSQKRLILVVKADNPDDLTDSLGNTDHGRILLLLLLTFMPLRGPALPAGVDCARPFDRKLIRNSLSHRVSLTPPWASILRRFFASCMPRRRASTMAT